MPSPEEALDARLLAIFKVEARELIQAMADALGGIEKGPAPEERAKLIESIFRSAHSLKGAARAVNVKEVESLCHAVESVFMEIKRRGAAPSQSLFDLLYKVLVGLDGLLRWLDAAEPGTEKPSVSGLVHELNLALKTLQKSGSGFQPEPLPSNPAPLQAHLPSIEAPPSFSSASSLREAGASPKPPVPPSPRPSGTVRVAATKLDAMLLQAAELIPPSMAAAQHAGRLHELGEAFAEWKKSWLRIRPAIRSLTQSLSVGGDRPEDRNVSRLLEFVEGNQQFAEQMDRQVAEISRTAEHDHRTLASLVDELLERAAEVAMQPFSTVLDLFPRFVRDTAREQNKEIETLALVRLVDLLSLPPENGREDKPTHFAAVLILSHGGRIALAVDAVLTEQEILVKPLGPQLSALRDFAGATVLGDGAVIPILSIPEMMKRARQAGATPSRRQAPSAGGAKEAAKSVLVAEDSITSRSLLKSILETAGYKVETAVDGIDAFTKLRSSHFDLVVSDVDMPRMNGFGLTSKIRADKRLAELPVVLVTSLDSASDREHGIDVGASAYIIKSTFDQTNLIEVVRQLL